VLVQNTAGTDNWSLGWSWNVRQEKIYRGEKRDWRCQCHVLMEWTYILWAEECRKVLVYLIFWSKKRKLSRGKYPFVFLTKGFLKIQL